MSLSICGYIVEGQPALARGGLSNAACFTTSPGYFRTMGIPLLKGRDFSQNDTEQAPQVAIINETMARYLWLNQDPIGKRIKSGPPEFPWISIVGVVKDTKQEDLTTELRPAFYTPYLQAAPPSVAVLVRAGSDPMSLAGAIRREVRSLDKELPVQDLRTMEQILHESTSEPRFNMLLLGTFAALALILASVGVYGVVSYSVLQRSQEMGIRMALGAQRRDVLKLVVSQGMTSALVGVGIGLAAALGLTRVMSSLLYGVQPTDPLTFVAVGLLVSFVALLASYIPARRATEVDPIVILRYE